jgi:hypothetical protein
MSEIKQAAAFTEVCTKGHRLFGKVSYCPFCGVEVTPVVVIKPQLPESTPELETIDLEAIDLEGIELEAIEPEIAKPEIAKPEITKPEITKPEIVKPSSGSDPVVNTPVKPLPNSGGFPRWMLVLAGLIVIFALFKMNDGGDSVTTDPILADAVQAPEVSIEPTPEPLAEPVPEPVAEPTPEPISEPSPEPTPVPMSAPEPKPEPAPVRQQSLPECPAENIAATTRSQVSSQKWVQASQFINQQLEKHAACATNKELLMLQDLALELKKYTRDHNPRSAKSGFESLIDKYGDKADLIKLRDFFNKALNEENNCAASGGNWDSDNFSCN